MTIITESNRTQFGLHLNISHEATRAFVSISPDGVRVLVQNASHRVFRRSGRHFPTFDAAIAHYKSAAMKAILHTAANYQHAP